MILVLHAYLTDTNVELDGIKVYPGSAVTVKWKGVWYDGVVVKMGPQKHLCEVQVLHTFFSA